VIEQLSLLRSGTSKRVSSYDRRGGNSDCWLIEGGETRQLCAIKGPGCIRHIWITVDAEDEWYLRKALLRAYWEGEASPSVEVPLGDFFGVGHGVVSSYSSAVLDMSAWPGDLKHAAMNCWFPMPFSGDARIEIANESELPLRAFYFYIDYELLAEPPEDHGRFHAKWRRENPTDGWVAVKPQEQPDRGAPGRARNLNDRDNFLFLDARGRGHFVGANLSVHNLCGGWWGEGDDMFMIDGEKWPPDLHGTGSEDYFCHAWGMQPQNAFPYAGVSYHKPGSTFSYNERITVYRYHVVDPVVFHESVRVSIEHGHANTHSNDYSATAYWYQVEPHHEFCEMPPADARVPRPDMVLQQAERPGPARTRAAVRQRMRQRPRASGRRGARGK
jgi:hypothetical protein